MCAFIRVCATPPPFPFPFQLDPPPNNNRRPPAGAAAGLVDPGLSPPYLMRRARAATPAPATRRMRRAMHLWIGGW